MPCSRAYPAAAILPSIPRSPKSTRQNDPIERSQSIDQQAFDIFGLDPFDLNVDVVMDTGVIQRLDDREIRVDETHVLSDDTDLGLSPRRRTHG